MNSEPNAKRLGSIWFAPGITYSNAAVGIYASFTTLNLLIYLNFIQPYLLTELLDIPRAEQGSITGQLAALQEVIVIIFISLIGALSDQWGRRLVYVIGFLFMGVGYFLYPLADSVSQLAIFRVVFAVGAATVPVMMSAIAIDYSQPVSRGKWIGIINLSSGLGVLFMSLVMARIPAWLERAGYEGAVTGRYTFWITSAACFAAAAILFLGLKGKSSGTTAAKPNPFLLVVEGLKAGARNPKLALTYAAAFIGRGDMIVIGLFLPLWAMHIGMENGLSPGEAMTHAGILLSVNQVAIICWAFVAGALNDRFSKISVLVFAFTACSVGYFGLWLIGDPFNSTVYIAIVILAIGSVSATVTTTAIAGEEASVDSRGSILGVIGAMGAIGIMIVTIIGGEIFDAIDPTAPFLMIVLFNLVIIVWALFVRLSGKR